MKTDSCSPLLAPGKAGVIFCSCRPRRWGLAVGLWILFFPALVFGQTKLWDQVYGGTRDDDLKALVQTRDGGFLLGGNSASDRGGDKSQDIRGGCVADPYDPLGFRCPSDFWVVKTDSAGLIQWDKTFGGPGEERERAAGHQTK